MCGIYRERLVREHIVPRWKFKSGLAQGNPNQKSNIQYICDNCHADKTWIDGTRERRAENAAKALAHLTPEQRSSNAKKARLALTVHYTPKERGDVIRKGHATLKANSTPEQINVRRLAAIESGRKGGATRTANTTYEQRCEIAKKAATKMTPEQRAHRSESLRQYHENRRKMLEAEQDAEPNLFS